MQRYFQSHIARNMYNMKDYTKARVPFISIEENVQSLLYIDDESLRFCKLVKHVLLWFSRSCKFFLDCNA